MLFEMKAADDATDPVEIKGLTLEIKDEAKGEVEAVIATLGVVDHDADVIQKGAIPDGAKVTMSEYGHDAIFGRRPVGKGALHTEANKIVFRGRYFLNTTNGRDAFETVKAMGSDQQWSFGFRVKGSEIADEEWQKKGARRILTKLDAFEVSPVIIAAGKGTRTLSVKEAKPDVTAEEQAALDEIAAKVEADTKARAEQQAKDDAAAIETKRLADEAERKALADSMRGECDRFQRTLRRLGVA
jgi:hypothetical protein